jgi:DNA-binding LacI/PurR family transcriptional regulator/signal transduction histidine kinase/ActR/RegA family two-component response regulator
MADEHSVEDEARLTQNAGNKSVTPVKVMAPRASQPLTRAPTFGVVVDWLEDEYHSRILGGVVEAARESGVNLLCFVGAESHEAFRFGEQREVVYDLVRSEGIDALVILAGRLGNNLGLGELARCREPHRPLPMSIIEERADGMTSILIDGEQALREGIRHLVENHGYRRIAFLGGPEVNPDAHVRVRAYREALTAHGLPSPDAYVAAGDFTYESGVDAVRVLLDERGATFDAIVVANDYMAFGVIDALRVRDIRVPRDVAIIGFDDVTEARDFAPPLTTIRQPLQQQGRLAVDALVRRLRGEQVDDVLILPAQLVIRRSCGCYSDGRRISTIGSQTPTPTRPGADLTVDDALRLRRSRILEAMRAPVSGLLDGIPEGWEGGLLDALVAELRGGPAGLTERVNSLLKETTESGATGNPWQPALSALRRELMPCLASDPIMRSRAEDLLEEARVLIGEAVADTMAQHRLMIERRTLALSDTAEMLSAAFDFESLGEALRECLPKLGVPSAYLVVHDGISSAGAHVAFAYDPQRDSEAIEGLRDAAIQGTFVPDGLLPVDRNYAMVVQPLFFKDDPFGYAIFEMGPVGGTIYDALRRQISGALKVTLLIDELRVRAGQLRQAQKMETLGQLAGAIAHDFNNLLQAIHGYAELAGAADPGNAELTADVNEIVRAADRASGLTRQMLTFSQPARANTRVVDVNACIGVAIPMIRHLIGPTIQLSTVLREEAGRILIDPTQLEQAIVNLCVNGRDAMPGGGSLTIETGRRPAAQEIASSRSASRPSLAHALTFVSVSDTGVGIPVDLRDRIFEPFFTTKPTGQGTGLGLSIVYGIVRNASGNVVVESEPGHGTRFWLTFPSSADPEEAPPIAVEARAIGTETVLLVEDEQAIRKLAERVLTKRGYRVLVAASAAEARELWATNEGSVDLLLSDVTMPGMSGVAFAAELAGSARPPRTLFISGYLAGGVGGPTLPAEASFLPKPFSVAALLDAVRAALDPPAVDRDGGESTPCRRCPRAVTFT